jgi:peroxidase family protein
MPTTPNTLTTTSASSNNSKPLHKGDYAPARPTDLRSPCPLINAMANHGYLPRDGRNVRASELKKAMDLTGLSTIMGSLLAYSPYLENVPEITAEGHVAEATKASRSIFRRIWYLIRNPLALVFQKFGVWMPGRKDSMGYKVVDLDQLASHNRIEHDISLTRRDYQQGNNKSLQPDLVKALLASSSDGESLTMANLCAFKRQRTGQQKKDNPDAVYGPTEHQIACGEIAMLLHAFGDGKSLRCDYAKAFFEQERLPIAEGWKRRRWWTIGFVEVFLAVKKVKALIGLKI